MFFNKKLKEYNKVDYLTVLSIICLVVIVIPFLYLGWKQDNINAQINYVITGQLVDLQIDECEHSLIQKYLVTIKLKTKDQTKIITTYCNNLNTLTKVLNVGDTYQIIVKNNYLENIKK